MLRTKNQNTNTNIITLEREKGKAEIDLEGYEKARRYAKHKLDWQNKRYNTKHSEEYLDKITLEIYQQQIAADHMMEIAGGRYE